MPELIHPAADELWKSRIAAADRVLVIGATGWLGRTVTALMHILPNATMLVSSRARPYEAGAVTATSVEWDTDAVESFQPTTVIDCAFLTRDAIATMGLDEYLRVNLQLTDRLLAAAALPSVRTVMTISSGAAVHPVDALTQSRAENPYGRLKREAEQSLAAVAADRGIDAVIARAWSVSGAFVVKPRSYAFTDMILQALEGEIAISAPMPVFRRYVSAEDLLAVSLAVAAPDTPVVDSGGPLLEMQELAKAIAAVANPRAVITRVPVSDAPANRYYADPAGWVERCAALGFTPASLDEQIRVAMSGVSSPS